MFLFLNWFHSAPSLLLCLYICIKWLHVMWAHMWQGNHIWMSEDFFWDLIFSLHDSFQDCRTNTLPTELSCSGFQNSYLTPLMYPVFMTVSAVLFCSPFFSSSTLTCFFFLTCTENTHFLTEYETVWHSLLGLTMSACEASGYTLSTFSSSTDRVVHHRKITLD